MKNTAQEFEREVSYANYQIDLRKVYYQKILSAVKRFSRDPGGRLLDIGCWDGTLAAQFLSAREVYGLEGNLDACKRARERGVKCEASDLEKGLPFPDKMFDCVIAAEVIEHLYDTDRFLREVYRTLHDKGLLVMSIPNIACLTNRIMMLWGRYPRYAEYRAGGAGHIRVYTAPVMRSQLTENGFEVIYFAGCNLPLPMENPCIPSWIKRFAVRAGDFFPAISGQVVLAARKKSKDEGPAHE